MTPEILKIDFRRVFPFLIAVLDAAVVNLWMGKVENVYMT